MNLRTARLTDQKLEGWMINAPEWAIEMFAEHPNFLVEDGHMFGFVTAEPL